MPPPILRGIQLETRLRHPRRPVQKIVARALCYPHHRRQQVQYLAREPRGRQTPLHGHHPQFLQPGMIPMAATVAIQAMGTTQIISRRPYQPYQAALYPTLSSHRPPASSLNGALVAPAQTPTCCPVPSISRLRQYKMAPAFLEKTIKTRREKARREGPEGKVQIKNQKPEFVSQNHAHIKGTAFGSSRLPSILVNTLTPLTLPTL